MLSELWEQYYRLDALIDDVRASPDVPVVRVLQAQLTIRQAMYDIEALVRYGEQLRPRLAIVSKKRHQHVDEKPQEGAHGTNGGEDT